MDIIGIDLDNTLIDYDQVWPMGLRDLGVDVPGELSGKQALRDWLRQQPEGEQTWQRLQAHAYGKGLQHAALAPGAADFISSCISQGIPVYIVSHKTAFANADPGGVNLRDAARCWLQEHGLVGNGALLPDTSLFFESTREKKVQRIRALDCSHFIDDLMETFQESGFPEQTKALLYAPAGKPESESTIPAFESWHDISAFFSQHWQAEERRLIEGFVRTQSVSADKTLRLGGGRNSRVYRVECEDGPPLAAKHYWRSDGAQRATTEFKAFRLLQNAGLDQVPKTIALDTEHALALFEYIEGAPAANNVSPETIDACVGFVHALTQLSHRNDSWTGEAKEAFVSFNGLIETISQRRSLFADAPDTTLHDFLKKEFDPVMQEVLAWVHDTLQRTNLDASLETVAEERVLSPSDFGLHNAIRRADGALCFLDFEYFGWDDPVKLVSDFLLHPAMDLNDTLRRGFVSGVIPAISDQRFEDRLPLAHALFGLKWCIILLNEYLPDHRARRAFAGNTREIDVLLSEQLQKARDMLAHVASHYREFPYL